MIEIIPMMSIISIIHILHDINVVGIIHIIYITSMICIIHIIRNTWITSIVPVFALIGQAEPPLAAGGREQCTIQDELNGLLAMPLALVVLRPSVLWTRSAAWPQKSTALVMMSRHGPLCGAAPSCGRHHVGAVKPSPSPAWRTPARRRSKMSVLSYNLFLRTKSNGKTSPGAQTFDPIPGPQVSPTILLFTPERRSCGERGQ